MAETTTTEKIYCTDSNSSINPILSALLTNQKDSPSATEMMALSNGGGFNGGMWNNPFAYILFMWLMRYMNGGWGVNGGEAAGLNYNSREISQIQDTLNNNQNSNLLMDAIKGNSSAIADLATATNTNYNTMSQAICGVRSAIETVGGQVGYSAEKVINAVNLGDLNIVQQLKDSSCAIKSSILSQGYENQLATERQTGILGSKIDAGQAASQLQNCQQTNSLTNSINTSTWNLSNGIDNTRQAIVNGFANIGYTEATNTASIIQAVNAAQQRTSDQLAVHWQAETSQALQDAKTEISQLKQTQAILTALNSSGCGCNCGN